MIRLKQNQSRSWFNPQHARRLSLELANRLVERCRGQRGLMITLTYNPEQWSDPKELYHATSEQRHVRSFIRSLSNIMEQDFTGRWLCKMEFQKNGNVHYHIVILGIDYIPKDRLDYCWGYGFTWVNRITASRLRYMCKYVSKAEDLPAFLLGEPQRSVKIVRVSPGFWPPQEKSARTDPPEPTTKIPAYVSIGEALERAKNSTIVTDEYATRYAKVNIDLYTLLTRLLEDGAVLAGCDHGWLLADVPFHQVKNEAAETAGGRRPPVHLKEGGNPHTHRHRWLDAILEERFTWLRNLPAAESEVA